MDYEVLWWLLNWRKRMRHMFGRQGGDILTILLILTRIYLSRTIWNNSYLFIITAILLVLNSITSVYMLFIYISRTIKQQIKLGHCNSEIQNGAYTTIHPIVGSDLIKLKRVPSPTHSFAITSKIIYKRSAQVVTAYGSFVNVSPSSLLPEMGHCA